MRSGTGASWLRMRTKKPFSIWPAGILKQGSSSAPSARRVLSSARGNQQISAAVVKNVGLQNLIVVATPHKLRETPSLYVDSGDPALDREFGESIQVISGYRIAQRKKISRSQ